MYTDPIYDWSICFPIIDSPLLHSTMSTKTSLVFIQCDIWKMLAFERPDCLDSFHSRWYLEPFNYIPMTTRWVIIWFFFHFFNKIGSIILFQYLMKCAVFIVWLPSSKNHVMNIIQLSVKVCIDQVTVMNFYIDWLLHMRESYWHLSTILKIFSQEVDPMGLTQNSPRSVYQKYLNPQSRFWKNPESVQISNNHYKPNGQWEFSKRRRLLQLEVRWFERWKDIELTWFDQLFSPTSRCHTNDQSASKCDYINRTIRSQRFWKKFVFEYPKVLSQTLASPSICWSLINAAPQLHTKY